MISRTHSNGRKYTLRYDDRGNIISETYPDGSEYAFDVAIITEED
jgi:YD repeat-containing protein